MYKNKLLLSMAVLAGVVSLSFASSQSTFAITGWNAGRIIDDSVFTANTSMSPSQIQSFLNAKVPDCDTYGEKLSENGGPDLNGDGKVQRWEWGKSRYNQTKFICLKNWKSSGGTSAAQVIYNKAQKYRISPKVLLVLLQKEQSLVTDTWPVNQQYRTATGYGCPDTAPCDTQYYGLQNQVDWAAKMFRSIMDDSPNWYTPYELGNNYIQYNPVASCGGSTVNIQNRATQALYNYTPYQPNKAALDAGWGSASCGAYGNRNFFLYFSNWFGRPNASATYGFSSASQEIYSDPGYSSRVGTSSATVAPGSSLYVKLTVKNTGNQVWYGDLLRLGTVEPKDRHSVFKDPTWLSPSRPAKLDQASVAPNETGTFRFKVTAPSDFGQRTEYFGLLIEGQRWFSGNIPLAFNVFTADPVYSVQRTELSYYRDSQRTQKLSGNIIAYNGSRLFVSMKLKNTGNREFPATTTKLATTNPLDRHSTLQDGSWLSPSRVVTAQEGALSPNETGTFLFSITVPDDHTTPLSERLGLVIDGSRWIDQNVAALDVNISPRPEEEITRGAQIFPGQSILSSNERFRLTLQRDGNLVLYSTNTSKALWHTKTWGRGSTKLIVQSDGNLVLYAGTKALWHTKTWGRGSTKLIVQSDGNLVLYAGTKALWHTSTNGAQ
jgi:hypothetical protein